MARSIKRNTNFIWLPVGIVLLILGIIFFKALSGIIKSAAVPLWRTRANSAQKIQTAVTSKNALQRQNQNLSQALINAQAKLALATALEDENKKLKAILGRAEEKPGILAGILTTPHQSLYNTFQIDAGSVEGINQGDKVLVGNATLVGTVTAVEAHTATVTALSSPGNKVSAVIAGSDITLTVTGRGGGDFEVELPRAMAFIDGTPILSQGAYSKVIAVVEKIISDPRDPFQKLLARTPVNIRSVKWVTVHPQ